jgi:hypothetical protein
MNPVTITTLEQQISRAASQIAGAIYDDASGTVLARIHLATAWTNQGTDGDLTSEDRIALRLLEDAPTGITSDLMDSDTAEKIRDATVEEAIDSALARPEGHILVDGRRCYVEL